MFIVFGLMNSGNVERENTGNRNRNYTKPLEFYY